MRILNYSRPFSIVFILYFFIFQFTSCKKGEETPVIPVSGIAIEQTSLTIVKDSKATLSASITPANASIPYVMWSSSNDTVATISDSIVTAHEVGEAYIKITSSDGGFADSCLITVIDTNNYECGLYNQADGIHSVNDGLYCSTQSDENAVNVSGGTFTMRYATVTKTGDSSDAEGSSADGANSAVLSTNDATLVVSRGTITTEALGANALCADAGLIQALDVEIETSKKYSRGLYTSNGGSIIASHIIISTAGNNSPVIANNLNGGSIDIVGGTYNSSGSNSAILHSANEIVVKNINGTAENSPIAIVDGNNMLTIEDSDLSTDAATSGLLMYQSNADNTGVGQNAEISIAGGSLATSHTNAPLIEVTSDITGQIKLNDVNVSIESGILMAVKYNNLYEKYGATGILTLSGIETNYAGNIEVDSASSAKVTLTETVSWDGAFNVSNSGKSTTLILDGATWNLTDSSYIDTLSLLNNAVINKNGFKLIYKQISDSDGAIND